MHAHFMTSDDLYYECIIIVRNYFVDSYTEFTTLFTIIIVFNEWIHTYVDITIGSLKTSARQTFHPEAAELIERNFSDLCHSITNPQQIAAELYANSLITYCEAQECIQPFVPRPRDDRFPDIRVIALLNAVYQNAEKSCEENGNNNIVNWFIDFLKDEGVEHASIMRDQYNSMYTTK